MGEPRGQEAAAMKGGRPGDTAYEICRRLRWMIVRGEIAPGSVVTQSGLARELDVSRTPVREAMRMLHQERLLEIEPNNCARVRGITAEDVVSAYSQRILLEALAISQSISHATAEDHRQLDQCLANMSGDDCRSDFELWQMHHSKFHRLLVCHSGDGLLRAIERLADDCLSYQYLVFDTNRESSWWSSRDSGHVELVATYMSGKAGWAARLLAQHYAQAAFLLLGEISDSPESDAARISATMEYAISGANGLSKTVARQMHDADGVPVALVPAQNGNPAS